MNTFKAQQAIEEIMERFDFESVRDYMLSVDWKYAAASLCEPSAVPDLDSLRNMAREVLHTAVYNSRGEEGHKSVRCGGFEARIDKWPGSDRYAIALCFVPFRREETF